MNRHLNRFANLFLLELSMFSLCTLIRDSFSLLLPAKTFAWLALLCFLLWIATSFSHGLLIGMPLSALELWYLYHERSVDLLNEMRDVLDRISAVYYGHFSEAALHSPDGLSGNHEVAILFVFFILGAFVAASLTSGSFRVSLTVLATVPLFALCIAVNGKPPVLPVVGFLLFLACLQLGGDVFRPDDAAGRATFLGLVPCLLILGALLLIYRPDTYEPTEYDYQLSQRFDKLGNALAELMSEDSDLRETVSNTLKVTASPVRRAPSGWDQGRDDLDLRADFDVSALDDEAFRVTASVEGSLYFRGRSYGDYNGSSWSAAVENPRGGALRFAGQAIAAHGSSQTGEFTLKSPSPYDVLYLPYYSIPDTGSDVRVSADGISNYSGSYYLSPIGAEALSGASSLPAELASDELQYREYAHSYYLRLPDSTRSALATICDARGWSAGQSGLLWSVAEYVRSQGIYDVNVEPYPSDDYAVYFLTESHTGYCIHFATAAVALYRTLGIPARVCEGYLVNNLNPGRSVRVTGGDAHAWAEVYLDGLGWIPVEVTASAAEGDYQPSEGSVAPTPETLPDGQDPDSAVTPTPPPDGSGNYPDPSDPYDSQSPDPAKNASDGAAEKTLSLADSPALRVTGIVILSLAGLFLLCFGRYLILRQILRKRLSDPNGNRRAVSYYRQAERVLRYGGEMPAFLMETAEKARFSQHEISEDELNRCSELLEELTQSVSASLSRRKRLFFRYLSGNQ